MKTLLKFISLIKQRWALVFSLLVAFAPLAWRLWQLAVGKLSGFAAEQGDILLGCMSDAICGAAVFLVLWLTPRFFRLIPALLWALFQIGALELHQAMGRYPVWQDLHYLFDADFARNSIDGFSLAAPLFSVFICTTAIACAIVRLPRVGLRRSLVAMALLGLFFLGHTHLANVASGSRVTSRYNPLHSFVLSARQSMQAHQLLKSLPPSLQQADLRGESLLPGGKGRAKNVLILIMEGIPGLYVPEIREAMGVHESPVTMAGLNSVTKGAMLVPDFVAHAHQTIRGLYSIFCGDFDKLSMDSPKAFEFSNMARPACLPNLMARQGWTTHFLQGAGLNFMAKDRTMAEMGFAEVHGKEWFDAQNIKKSFPFEWGMDDATFFPGALRYIEDLRKNEKPWMLALLTVGTHYPYAVPKDVDKSLRKDLAVVRLDEAVVPFLNSLRADGVLEDTLLIVTSDESHGASLGNWTSAWGLNMVFAPEQADLPRIKRGVYGLVDMEASVLDYFGLQAPEKIVGRSFFRDYKEPREMLAYTTGVLRRHTMGTLIECNDGGACTGLATASFSGAHSENNREVLGASLSEETRAIALTLDKKYHIESGEQVFKLAHGEVRRVNKENGDNNWSSPFIGGHYIELPENSDVTVHLKLTVLEGEESGMPLKLWALANNKSTDDPPMPDLPKVLPGESLDRSFSFHNRERRSFFIQVVTSGRKGAVRFDDFSFTVRPAK